VTKRAWKEAKSDQVPLLAAGVAFFTFMSIFPALIAAITTWGLVADPKQIRSQVDDMSGTLPASARDLIMKQVDSLTATPAQSLGFGLVISLLVALWSASGGISNLIDAVNVAYDEEDDRGFVKKKLLALGMTLAAIVVGLLALALIAAAPVIFQALGLPTGLRILVEIGRWVLLLALVMVALAVTYRLAPNRDAPKFSWASVGAVVATVVWLVASLAFSIYVANFGSYSKTYGSLAAVVVLLLWLWITFYIVLLGAEINAEAEAQTARDTTRRAERPMGERDAVKADQPPPG
jgi:membrane protein